MDRQSALVLTIIFFFMFYVLLYYGVRITMGASIVLATFISLILLNIFYSPKQVIDDESDFTLVIYGIFEIIGIIIIIIYVLYKTLTDVRQMDCNWITN
jgi:hypothetical protein